MATAPFAALSGCSLASTIPISEDAATALAEESLELAPSQIPLGNFYLKPGINPDTSDSPQQNLYGRLTFRDLTAAQQAGVISFSFQTPNLFSGQMNSQGTASAIDPLPEYVNRDQLPSRLVISVGERRCSESVGLDTVDDTEVSDRPVILYECRVTFTPNEFGEAREREWSGTPEYTPSYWLREGKARFLMEWDNFGDAYKVSKWEFVSADSNDWPGEIERRIATLRGSTD